MKETENNDEKRNTVTKPSINWNGIDWGKSDSVIALSLNVSVDTVMAKRRIHEPQVN